MNLKQYLRGIARYFSKNVKTSRFAKVSTTLLLFVVPFAANPAIADPTNTSIRPIVAISAGLHHTCAMFDDQNVTCWGLNESGQIDIPSDLGTVNQISAGASHTCAIKINGQAQCWGNNASGQTTVPTDLGSISQISAAYNRTCAIKTNGQAQCWGDNARFQNTIPANLGSVVEIKTSQDFTCAMLANHRASCWGYGPNGETAVPAALGNILQITAGVNHVCVIKVNKQAQCWGLNGNSETTVPKTLGTLTGIYAGYQHTCTIKSNGSTTCWGSNSSRESIVPTTLPASNYLALGVSHTCSLSKDGKVYCWGVTSPEITASPNFPQSRRPISISAGSDRTCIITVQSEAKCWGENSEWESVIPNVSSVTTGWYTSCAMKTNGEAICWGFGNFVVGSVPADLGIIRAISTGGNDLTCAIQISKNVRCWKQSSYLDRGTLVPVGLGEVKSISTGSDFACAIHQSDLVVCWGDNSMGQIDVPQDLGKVKQISSSFQNACAITDEDLARCWGGLNYQNYGQVSVPVGLGTVIEISAGTDHTCVVKTSGEPQCWGDNTYGQSTIPLNLGTVTKITTGSSHTCVIKTNGDPQCWGKNSSGQTEIPKYRYYQPLAPTDLKLMPNGDAGMVASVSPPSDSFGPLTLVVTETKSGRILCEGSPFDECAIPSIKIGQAYQVSAGFRGEGESLWHTSPITFNCGQDQGMSSNVTLQSPVSGAKIRFFGTLSNFCPNFPSNIQFRERSVGKTWGQWQTYSVASKKYSFTKSYLVPTDVQIQSTNKIGQKVESSTSINVRPGPFYSKVSSSKTYTRQGFSQGGYLTYSFRTGPGYNGSCHFSATNDFALNFAGTFMGEESNDIDFPIRKGIGKGTLKMRWSGEVDTSIHCSSPAFPNDTYESTKTVVLKLNF